MADMSIVGAVAVRVRPDATSFREQLKRDVMRELSGYDPEVAVNARFDDGRKLKEDVRRAVKSASTDVKIGLNEEFLKRDFARVKFEMERLTDKSIDIGVKTDKLEKAIAKQRTAFAEVEAAKRKQIELEATLEKATINLAEAQLKLLESEKKLSSGQNAARATKEYDKAKSAVASFEKQIAKLSREQEKSNAALEESLANQRELAGDLAKIYKDSQAIIDAQEASYEEQTRQLKEQLELERQMNTIRTASREQVITMLSEQREGNEELSATLDRILEQADQLGSVEFKELREWASGGFNRDKVAKLRVEADTAMAEAELTALERTRSVRFLAYVDSSFSRIASTLRSGGDLDKGIDSVSQKYKTMFAGGALAASGVNNVRAMTTYMALSSAHMDKMAVSSAVLSHGIAAVSGTLIAGIGLLSKTANDIVAIGRGGVIAPAALAAIGVAAATSYRGLAVLNEGLKGNVEELDKVAPATVPAVNAVNDLFSAADRVGKERFFASMLGEIEKLPSSVEPISWLWSDAYEEQGKFFNGVLSGVRDWNASGDMSLSIGNIARSLREASFAGKPLTQSLLDIVTVGSEYLPDVGSKVSELARRYADFTREAKETRKINEWIEEAWLQVTYLGGAVKGTTGLVGGLSKAADEAGIGGLKSFSDGLNKVSDEVNSPIWQAGLTNIFRGARDGARLASSGMGELSRSVIDTSSYWEHFGRSSGDSFGKITGHLGSMNRESRFLPGLRSMFDDVNSVAGRAESLLRNAGNAMGDGAVLAGKLVDSGFKVADAFMRAWGSADKLTGGLADIIPVSGNVASDLISITHVLAGPVLDGVGSLLSIISGVPQPVLLASTAFAIFAGSVSKLRAVGDGRVLAGIGSQFPIVGNAAEAARSKVNQFRSGWEMMSNMLRNGVSFESANRYLSIMDRNFGNVGRTAGQSALGVAQIHSALSKTNFAAAGNEASRFTTALAGVKNVGVAGLRGSLTGLTNFLGGPWGVAFMMAAAFVGTWASEVAEGKRHVDALQSSLGESGEVTLQTAQQLAQGFENYGTAIGNWFDKANEWTMNLIPGVEQIWTFEGAVAATGKTMADLGADVAASGGNWSEYRGALEEANRIIDENGSLTAEQARELFGTGEAAKITGSMFRDLRAEWDRNNNALKEARQKHEDFANAMGLTSREASVLKKQIEVLNNEQASTAQRAAASKEVIDLLHGQTRSFLNSVNQQEQSLGSLSSAFDTVSKSGKGGANAFIEYTNALGETSWRLDTTVSELGSLDSALQQSYDSAVSHAQAVFDNARAHGDSVAGASAKANEAMGQWRSSASAQLQQMGADAKQAEAYLNDIAGEPWAVEVTFLGKAEEYLRAQELVESSGKRFDGQSFTAFLKANPDISVKTIESLVDMGISWSSSKYEASLLADGADAKSALDEVIQRGRDFTQEDMVAYLDGDRSGFLDAVIAAKADGEAFHTSEWRSKLGIDWDEWKAIYPHVIREGEEFGSKEWVARMDMENPGFAEKFYAAEANLLGLTEKDWNAHVTSNVDEVKQAQEGLVSSLQAMNGTSSEVTIVSNAATEIAVAQAYQLLISGMSGQEVQTRLRMDDEEWRTVVEALPGDFSAAISHIQPVPIDGDTAPLDAKLQEASGKVSANWVGVPYKANLDADTIPLDTSLGRAVASGNSFSGQSFTAALNGNELGMVKAKGASDRLGALHNSSLYTASLDGNNGPMQLASSLADAIGNAFRLTVFTSTLSGDKSHMAYATGEADSIGRSFGSNIYTGTLQANDQASGVVKSLLDSAFSWGGKTFTATFSAIASKLGFADGGIVNGAGVQTFASGGFSIPRENHRAVIASPSSTLRVWAEPETGGEAYIPLALSKRTRSTEILGQVADKFGLTVVKQFSNGGVEHVGGSSPSSQVPNIVIENVYGHYPDDVADALYKRLYEEMALRI